MSRHVAREERVRPAGHMVLVTQGWLWFLGLSVWQQAALLGVALVASASAVRGLITARQGRRRTVYVLDERGRVGERVSPEETGVVSRSISPGEAFVSDGLQGELAEDRSEEGSAAAWANGRPVCPCCEYPTNHDAYHACALCDWEEPVAPEAGWEVAPRERQSQLDRARARYAATGSALSAEERLEWAGELTPRERELRSELRTSLDYLKVGDRPDSSEAWEVVDNLLAALKEEAERKRSEEPESG